jgi:uncharacterized SAM-binding protein YcdF (DUF218 family)
MYELAKLGAYLLSPLTLVLGLGVIGGLCMAFGLRRLAAACVSLAFISLWLASTPIVAQALAGALETWYPVLSVQAAPQADAIVVLGGSVIGRRPPERPSITLTSASTRVWYAAELYRAGKAKWIVVAAGGQPEFPNEQVEAQAIAEMLGVLGVPATAIRLDTNSRNTVQNAANVQPILAQLGARRVLLVTSAQHMARAVQTFTKVWANSHIELIPAPTDPEAGQKTSALVSWIPSLNALIGVTRALKEYAGMAVLGIIGPVTL